ncbi:hypothetical protein [Pelagicoccus sp. SDUM812002]|uniref:hypothetical protein n=1 Tax=Pelagicoccus sp. SDUM812002 TaxID=3041266 RepID=UPI00280F037F|nr:hypothetical protein [Pelagicoccus sp. SDUM812002]MDQ8188548.1 hypothetical protein [Pelagicoccus sp. SDUM812002]
MNTSEILTFIRVTGEFFNEEPEHKTVGDFYIKYADESKNKDEKTLRAELKYFITDIGEMFSETYGELLKFDEYFLSKGSISVSQFLMLYRGSMKKILKRGKIRNEDEAIAVNGLLSNVDDSTVSSEDRKKLEELLQTFEQKLA